MNATNIPQSTSRRNHDHISVVPRANRDAAHFILTAARILRTQSNGANLGRLAGSLIAIADRLRGMDDEIGTR